MDSNNIRFGSMQCPHCGMERGTDLSPCACGYDPKIGDNSWINMIEIEETYASERERLNKEQEKLVCPHCQFVKDNADDICKACGFNPRTGQIEKFWSSDSLKFPFVEEKEEPLKPPTMPFVNMGWVCPQCGSVYAPHISSCWRCGNNTYKPIEIWC